MSQVRWDENGLAPAIVQDVETARVLMLGWMNEEALARTLAAGRVTFWSRSRGELWEKGATSGNWLELVSVAPDCDGDALLVGARPHGPTCHTGAATCWGEQAAAGFASLDRLWTVISERAKRRPEGSYTSALLSRGVEGVGRKVVEEALETLLAAKDHAAGSADDRRLAEEAADLLYHVLVLLAERQVAPSEVMAVLAERRPPEDR